MYPPEQLSSLPPELRAYILALEGRAAADQKQIGALQQRVSFLEDQFRLAQLKRFAPSSEKLGGQGCLFNEAEQDAAAFPESEATHEEDTPRSPPKNARSPCPAGAPAAQARRT